MSNRTRIDKGIEVSTTEYFIALRAVNFIMRENMSWSIEPEVHRHYDLEIMFEHAKNIAAERGIVVSLEKGITGFLSIEKI